MRRPQKCVTRCHYFLYTTLVVWIIGIGDFKIMFRKFDNITELIEHFARYVDVNYQAPMDHGVGTFKVRAFTFNRINVKKSTVKVWSRTTRVLTLNIVDHFDRFRMYERPAVAKEL